MCRQNHPADTQAVQNETELIMGVINYRDSRPIYEQIAEHYRQLILSGVMEADEQMPSVRNLAMELSTNPNTIQKAYAELIRDGYIYTVKGLGNFVSGNSGLLEQKKEEMRARLEELRNEGLKLGLDMDLIWREISETKRGSETISRDWTGKDRS